MSATRFLRQQNEDALRDVLREMGVPAQLPQGRVVNEPEVPLHNFSESRFRAFLDIPTKQLCIIRHRVYPIMAATAPNSTNNFLELPMVRLSLRRQLYPDRQHMHEVVRRLVGGSRNPTLGQKLNAVARNSCSVP